MSVRTWYTDSVSCANLTPQSRFGDKSLGIKMVCPQIGTAVLIKGLRTAVSPVLMTHYYLESERFVPKTGLTAVGSKRVNSV